MVSIPLNCIRKSMPSVRAAMPNALLVLVLIAVVGCSAMTVRQEDQPLPDLSGQAAALVEPGPFEHVLETGEHRGAYGCSMAYESYRPIGSSGDTMVFLAHGFLRDLETMRGWADHWASHGVAVTVMSLCNSSLFVGRHDRNAVDILALANRLHDGPVIYTGFSAGGLAAHIAATDDSRTVGYLGLDSVDHKGLARMAKPTVPYAALLVVAEPSACNRKNNMLDSTEGMAAYRAVRINNGTHCHFEYPYDAQCEVACGTVRPREWNIALIETVRSLATAWILEQAAGGAPSGQMRIFSRIANGEWQGRAEIVR